jgi:hypothetical protein
MGTAAARLVLENLGGPGTAAAERVVRLATRLVIRASTAPAPAAGAEPRRHPLDQAAAAVVDATSDPSLPLAAPGKTQRPIQPLPSRGDLPNRRPEAGAVARGRRKEVSVSGASTRPRAGS